VFLCCPSSHGGHSVSGQIFSTQSGQGGHVEGPVSGAEALSSCSLISLEIISASFLSPSRLANSSTLGA